MPDLRDAGSVVAVFQRHGGMLRMSEALRLGIQRSQLRRLKQEGVIERLSRGLYRLSSLPPLSNPDLALAGRRIPNGVICLISALAHYGLTTQVPHEVYIALRQGSESPRLEFPPVRVFRFSSATFTQGIVEEKIDGSPVRFYSVEKTLADCFKFRNRIGIETAIEGLRLYREGRRMRVKDLIHYARLCRVENVMRPYLEALL